MAKFHVINQKENETSSSSPSRKNHFIIFAVVLIVAVVIAFLIGYFVKKSASSSVSCKTDTKLNDGRVTAKQEELFKDIVNSISLDELRSNLRYFAGKPHAASTKRNNDILENIYQRFKSYNFEAEKFEYSVLLSFPDLKKRNYVYVMDSSTNKEIFKSKGIEDFLEPSENDTTAFPPFNAYSPNGTVQGELVYANYGRFEDFEELQSKYKVNVSGKIVIFRYGKIFRGDKVKNAQARGAIGCIIYSDPYDYTPVPDNQTFPNGRWLPSDGVQRGSIITSSGDPLTKDYPAKDWYYHEEPSKNKNLPKIPTQPISAYDAYHLFSRMGGVAVNKEWSGKFNVTYRVGPFTNTKEQVKVEVNNILDVRKITNICGTIKGEVEPDRYVLMGNHVDAWVAGAVDPSSGTTVMMEIARVVAMKMKQSDWIPHRTIKFCGWDGEEQSIIGSVEYVEEFRSQLRDRAVAYINLDSAVSGNESMNFAASPLLKDLLFKVTKNVKDPFDDVMTVFDKTQQVVPDLNNHTERFKVGTLGSGSDYFAFYQFIGVPSYDMGYQQMITNKKLGIGGYPMYHSLHDTVYWMEHFVDKEYKVHRCVAQVATYLLLHLSDVLLLPMTTKQYGSLIMKHIADLDKQFEKKGASLHGVSTDYLKKAGRKFSTTTSQADEEVNKSKDFSALGLRMLNDRLVQVEKGFIFPIGLPGRHDIKHYMMAPSLHNVYGSSGFPAVTDLLYDIEKTGNWDEVKKQLSITTSLIDAAAESLKAL